MATKQLAPGVLQIPLDRLQGVNAYLVGDVLVDAGGRQAAAAILAALAGRPVTLHALTHAHPDHQGSSHAIASELGLPFAVPRGETAMAESGDFAAGRTLPPSRRARFVARMVGGPGHPVDRELVAGDEAGGFTVVALPGHSPGHVGYWRDQDRVLIAGDALRNISYATGQPRPDLPAQFFNDDQALTRASAEMIAAMRPSLIAFGHGRPIVGTAAVERALERVLA